MIFDPMEPLHWCVPQLSSPFFDDWTLLVEAWHPICFREAIP
jgi:hypothetical protein